MPLPKDANVQIPTKSHSFLQIPVLFMNTFELRTRELLSRLNEKEISYWVDSGTLLGLVRENELLSEDPDVDLSAWCSEVDDIIEIGKKSSDFDIRIKKYKGIVNNVKILPRFSDSRDIDIKIFRKKEKFAVSPIGVGKPNDYSRYNPIYYIYGSLRHLVHSIYYGDQVLIPDISKVRCGKGLRHDINWWVIPIDLINDIIMMEDYDVLVPESPQDLLEYRYGNWKEPDPSWNWKVDDGALHKTLPDGIEW